MSSVTLFDKIKFLIEKHYEETRLFWIRSNVYLVLNVGALTLVLSNLVGDDKLPWEIFSGISLVSLVFCFQWWKTITISRFYSHRWRDDAIRLARENPEMIKTFYYSLDFRQYPNVFGYGHIMTEPFRDRKRPLVRDRKRLSKGATATEFFRCVVILIGLAWLGLFLYAIGELVFKWSNVAAVQL